MAIEIAEVMGAAGSAGGALAVCLVWITRSLVPSLMEQMEKDRISFIEELRDERASRDAGMETITALAMEVRALAVEIRTHTSVDHGGSPSGRLVAEG